MSTTPIRKDALRCFCAHRPILAMQGLDAKGKPFVHIKVYKAQRVYGEMIFTFGEMRIKCRECYRWHTIKILGNKAVLSDIPEDEDIVDFVDPDAA